MESVAFFSVTFLCIVHRSSEIFSMHYSFEEYRCEGDIRIDGETEVFVTYSGGKIDSLCYVMGIMGRDAQNLKRYRLCLETLVYSDPDCELLVGLISSDPQEYNCTHAPPTRVCYGQDKNLRIHIEPITADVLSRNASFVFKVNAFETENKMTLITYIMGGGGGGLVLVVLLITGIKIYRSRQQTQAQKNTGETETDVCENSIYDFNL
ncbi:uncharacterized protein LOC128159042 isoform X1 [Crassostrea angulata]|uniref:uncharacterized protein LOC128159042 isoform X1 n=1 Tax=Magallana angulata TaxID=2784310 RepID=UPI0022B18329|nr:uncharacterized protein LOC128159042 isoform X1 [Crassostrea angulata]